VFHGRGFSIIGLGSAAKKPNRPLFSELCLAVMAVVIAEVVLERVSVDPVVGTFLPDKAGEGQS
jgi:hypothetical protein